MSTEMYKSLPTGPKMIWFYTGCILFYLMAYGLSTNLSGPALVDLHFVYTTSVETMSYLASFFAIGYMLGSLVPWLMRWLNRQVTLAFAMLIQSFALMAMPHAGLINWLYAMAATYGFGGGVFDSTFNIWMVDMWPTTSEPFLQAAAFSFGLGMIIGPLVMAPFIYGEIEVIVDVVNNATIAITAEDRKWRLSVPFGVASLISAIVPLMLLAAYFIAPYRKASKRIADLEEEGEQDVQWTSNSNFEITKNVDRRIQVEKEEIIPYRILKILLAICSIGFYGAFEASFFSFFAAALQYLPVAMSASEAASVLSIAGVTFSIGRGLAVFLSLRFSPDTLLTVHNSIIIGSLAVIYTWRDNSQVIIVGTAFLGLGISAVWSAYISFIERYLGLTDGLCSCFSFTSGTLTFLMPFAISGALKTNPIVLLYALGACSFLTTTFFVLLKLFTIFAPKKMAKN